MKLDSFRELLAKKAQDVSLQNIVKFMQEDVLAELVVDSLEKMARSSHKGDAANLAIRDFGTEMDPSHEPNMIHDALSHHISNYKSALGAGNKDVANQHAKQAFKIMDMADQAQKHSHGKLQVEAVSPHAWERNKHNETFGDRIEKLKAAKEKGEPISAKEEEWISNNPVTNGRKKPGQFITDTKAWRNRGNDYAFLQDAPHSSYGQEIRRHGHNQAYPFEHIKINGKHVDVEDKEPSNKYESHPFDSHPVMKHFEESAASRTPERDKQYMSERDKYAESPELNKYFEDQEAREKSNPEAYKKRGSERSKPVHKPVEPLDTSKEQAPEATKEAAKKPAEGKPKEKLTREARQALMAKLTPEVRAQFEELYPDEDK